MLLQAKGMCMHEHAYIAVQCILRDLDDVWLKCFCCSRCTPHVQLKDCWWALSHGSNHCIPGYCRVRCAAVTHSGLCWYFCSVLKIVTSCKASQDTRDAQLIMVLWMIQNCRVQQMPKLAATYLAQSQYASEELMMC